MTARHWAERVSLLAVAGLLVGCLGVAHDGFGVMVRNNCGTTIEFDMDAGTSPAAPDTRLSRLNVGEVKTYSLIAGDTGGYIWITSPEQAGPVRFDSPPSDEDVIVEVSGSSCEAVVLSP
jgi:hypothetical protein